jgi:hypothetical protein
MAMITAWGISLATILTLSSVVLPDTRRLVIAIMGLLLVHSLCFLQRTTLLVSFYERGIDD